MYQVTIGAHTYTLEPSSTIADLRCEAKVAPADQMRLIFSGKVLNDTETLNEVFGQQYSPKVFAIPQTVTSSDPPQQKKIDIGAALNNCKFFLHFSHLSF